MNKFFIPVLFLLLGSFLIPEALGAKEDLEIRQGRHVKLHYSLKSEGKLVDKSRRNRPLEFQLGQEVLFPGFEKNILGMKAGEKKKFELTPEEGYGSWNPNLVEIINRSELPDGKLKPGMILTAAHAYSAQTLSGRITKIIGDDVGIDFNHPLAGKTLQVEVKILEVSHG